MAGRRAGRRRLPEAELATDPGTDGWPNEDFAAVAPGQLPGRRAERHRGAAHLGAG
jgi:hypothetical protein